MHPVSFHEQHEQPQDTNKETLPFQTPPTRPLPAPQEVSKSRKTPSSSSMSTESSARRKISPMPSEQQQDEDEEYTRFVQSLGQDDPMMSTSALQSILLDDDEEDFVLTDLDDDEDDDDDDDVLGDLGDIPPSSPGGASTRTTRNLPASPFLLDQAEFYSELEAELGSLLEEDLEAAVTTLLAGTTNKKSTGVSPSKPPVGNAPLKATSGNNPSTPLRDAAASAKIHQNTVTPKQVSQLKKLMESHYQLLIQSAVLSVRAARKEYPEESPLVFGGGETPEDFTEILDGAVGMLQDLDQNRKDAIRNYIQRCETTPQAQRSLLPQLKGCTNRRLTRSAFHSLSESTNAQTIFDVDGLYSLKQTFFTIDHCGARQQEGLDILQPVQHFDACRQLLEQAGAKIHEGLLPGKTDIGNALCDPKEVFGEHYTPPTSIPQQIQLRKNRNQFTAAEDNLILRGVNLYGEKQWLLIADRFLPDRSVNIISQRYSKLCLLLFKAHGIQIDENGCLPTPPRFDKVDQLDEAAIAKIKPASPPAILNVHRWSIEEDVTLLRAVPLLGNQWAELSSRLIPHRDRGHLRKRYQVLERRIKATTARNKRGDVPMIPRTLTMATSNARPPVSRMPAATQAPRQPRKRKEPSRPAMPAHPGSIIRGPMPGRLLCPTNTNGQKQTGAPTHPGAPKQTGSKPGRKTMEFQARSTSTRNEPVNVHQNGGYSHHPGYPPHPHGGYAYPNGGYPYPNGGAYPNGGGYPHSPGYPPRSAGYPHASPGGLDSSHEASRFERIINDPTDDWSQMSRMRKMMENENEYMAADAIVNNLATGMLDPPPPTQMERVLPLETQSSSGFTNSNAREAEEVAKGPETPPKQQQTGSIMASVLERTRKEEPANASSPGEENGRSNNMEPAAPTTPSRPPQKFPLSNYGTPLGVSPGAGLHMRSFFSPDGHKNGHSPGLKAFSPGDGAHSLMIGGGENSNDYQLYPIQLTEGSRQAIEDSEGDSTMQPVGTSNPPTPSDVFQGSHHDLKSTDLEAISALNSLSNSPAKFLQNRPDSETTSDRNEKVDTTKKSLFAKAVESLDRKESDRKKRRTK